MLTTVAYVLTKITDPKEKNAYYEQLTAVIERIPPHDIENFLTDANAMHVLNFRELSSAVSTTLSIQPPMKMDNDYYSSLPTRTSVP